ncbi:MAG: glycoside hydrolase family 25 [Eubacteriaceae bacterium]|jgi:lysozyme|nr:glycoside hydrolase family 25 [Eubacteriaceae bacterium]
MEQKKGTLKKIGWIATGLAILALVIAVVVLTMMFRKDLGYVKGVDLSAYQGDVDFQQLEEQNIHFVYIKATEGTHMEDIRFLDNWENVKKTSMAYGAYHFMDFEVGGRVQADYYIDRVPRSEKALPPVIDIELYGEYLEKPMEAKKVKKNIKEMIERLTSYYEKSPIIYTNYQTYDLYLKNDFKDSRIWIADYNSQEPGLSGGHKWVFWQYTDRGLLNGYEGSERFIDMNAYNGEMSDFVKEFQLDTTPGK